MPGPRGGLLADASGKPPPDLATYLEKAKAKKGSAAKKLANERKAVLAQEIAAIDAMLAKLPRTVAWEEKRADWIDAQNASVRQIANFLAQVGTFGKYDRPGAGNFGMAMLKSIKIDFNKLTAPSAHTARLVVNDSRSEITVALSKAGDFFSPVMFGAFDEWERKIGRAHV